MHLTPSHLTIQLKPKVQNICKNFLEQNDFSYFQYLRCYADGSIGLLTNNTGLMEYFSEVDNQPVVFSSFNEEYDKLYSYWFLWDQELPEQPVSLAREKFGFCHGITFVRRSKSHYDMIAVALAKPIANPSSFYLNKIKMIEYFINDFDKNNQDLLKLMDNNPLILPPAYRDENYQKLCLSNNKIMVQTDVGLTYVTAREIACLRLFLHGASVKETSQILHLSPRTIETYLARIKERTKLSSHSDLTLLMKFCP